MFLFVVAFLPVIFKFGFVSLSTLQHRNCPNGYRLKTENSACIGKLLTIHRLKRKNRICILLIELYNFPRVFYRLLV